jgi:hypothetical protein
MRLPQEGCPECQDDRWVFKTIESPVTVDHNTVPVAVEVAECIQCGFQLHDADASAKLSAAYDQLEAGDTSSWVPVGTVYRQ